MFYTCSNAWARTCEIYREEKMMGNTLLIFGAIALIIGVIYKIATKQNISDLHIKLNVFKGFELKCKFRN